MAGKSTSAWSETPKQEKSTVGTPNEEASFDLSDPTAFDLLRDEDGDDVLEQVSDAEKSLMTLEMTRQNGVEIVGSHIEIPGRVPLMTMTLLEIFFLVCGLCAGFVHFLVMSPNYLLAIVVFSCIMFVQIIIYHSSYRAKRNVMMWIHVLGTSGIMAFVGWAMVDLMRHPPIEGQRNFLLLIALISYSLIPISMILHFVFLGRGHREVDIRRKVKKMIEAPTQILKTAANTPTKLIKSSQDSGTTSTTIKMDKVD